jgi:hypothetical protein
MVLLNSSPADLASHMHAQRRADTCIVYMGQQMKLDNLSHDSKQCLVLTASSAAHVLTVDLRVR